MLLRYIGDPCTHAIMTHHQMLLRYIGDPCTLRIRASWVLIDWQPPGIFLSLWECLTHALNAVQRRDLRQELRGTGLSTLRAMNLHIEDEGRVVEKLLAEACWHGKWGEKGGMVKSNTRTRQNVWMLTWPRRYHNPFRIHGLDFLHSLLIVLENNIFTL
jgi:hypothetical protein